MESVAYKEVLTVYRVLVSLIFVVAGFKHLIDTDAIVERLKKMLFTPLQEELASLDTRAFITGVVILVNSYGLREIIKLKAQGYIRLDI